MNNVLVGIQARSNSKRFPRKIYQKIGDRTLLQWVYDSAKAVKLYPKILNIMTYVLGVESDTDLQNFCKSENIDALFFDCDENDLWKRYLLAAERREADMIVRITADCPLLPTAMIERCIEGLLSDDYVSNTVTRTYPDGFDIQGVSRKALEWMAEYAVGDAEHPFKAFDRNETVRDRFEEAGFTWREIVNRDNVILEKRSIDSPEDLARVRRIVQKTA